MTNTECLTASTQSLGSPPVPGSSHIGRFLWALAGVLIAVLTAGWLLWFSPHPLLAPGGLDRPMTACLNPAVYAAGLSVWGCFTRASHRPPAEGRSNHHIQGEVR
jgi:hypothetical protein